MRRFDHHTIDDQFDGMPATVLHGDLVVEGIHCAVNADALVAVLFLAGEQFGILFGADALDRGEQQSLGARRQSQYSFDDVVAGLRADGLSARRAVRLAEAGVEHAQIVINLGDCAHGASRRVACGLLLDGDGRRQAFDVLHRRLLQLAQELPGVGAEALDIAPLAFGVQRVHGQRTLAAAG